MDISITLLIEGNESLVALSKERAGAAYCRRGTGVPATSFDFKPVLIG
jgi:hypothetical protein